MADTTTAPIPAKSKLAILRQREADLKAKIAAVEAKEKSKTRKEDTRLKVIVGAGLLADAAIYPATAALLREVLQRAITADRDREFLKLKGWL
jgi:hypothetical protein